MYELDLHVTRHERTDTARHGRDIRAHRTHLNRCSASHERLVDDRPHDKRSCRDAQRVGNGGSDVGDADASKNRVVRHVLSLRFEYLEFDTLDGSAHTTSVAVPRYVTLDD